MYMYMSCICSIYRNMYIYWEKWYIWCLFGYNEV